MGYESIKTGGRKKSKRYDIKQLNKILLMLVNVDRGKIVDLNYESGNFIISVSKNKTLKKYQIKAKIVVDYINGISPSDYKKYHSNKEFFIDYSKMKLEKMKKKFHNIYNSDITDFFPFSESYDLVLLKSQDNQILTLGKSTYDKYVDTKNRTN